MYCMMQDILLSYVLYGAGYITIICTVWCRIYYYHMYCMVQDILLSYVLYDAGYITIICTVWCRIYYYHMYCMMQDILLSYVLYDAGYITVIVNNKSSRLVFQLSLSQPLAFKKLLISAFEKASSRTLHRGRGWLRKA